MSKDSKTLERQFLDSINESRKIIYKIGRLYFNTPDEQADFSQDVLINAWRSYSKFRNESKFSTWLYRIAINTAFYQLRSKKDIKQIELTEVHDTLLPEKVTSENLDKLLLAAEFLNESEKALLALYMEDLTYEQMSEVLGISINLVGVRLNRLKEKLKTIIKKIK